MRTSNGSHKNQHWIPKSYLKRWLDPEFRGKVIRRYTREGVYCDYRPISRVFSESDLYTVVGLNGERDLGTENALSWLETKYDRSVRQFEIGRPFTPEDRMHVIAFMAGMHNRLPTVRDRRNQIVQEAIIEVDVIAKQLETAFATASPEQRAHMTRGLSSRGRPGIPLAQWRASGDLQFGEWLPHVIVRDLRAMSEMSLVLLSAPGQSFFISSDRPVTWWHTRSLGRLEGVDASNPHLEISMPLSPSVCAVLSNGGLEGTALAPATTVHHINMRTMSHCDDYLFSHRPNLKMEWLDRLFPASNAPLIVTPF